MKNLANFGRNFGCLLFPHCANAQFFGACLLRSLMGPQVSHTIFSRLPNVLLHIAKIPVLLPTFLNLKTQQLVETSSKWLSWQHAKSLLSSFGGQHRPNQGWPDYYVRWVTSENDKADARFLCTFPTSNENKNASLLRCVTKIRNGLGNDSDWRSEATQSLPVSAIVSSAVGDAHTCTLCDGDKVNICPSYPKSLVRLIGGTPMG